MIKESAHECVISRGIKVRLADTEEKPYSLSWKSKSHCYVFRNAKRLVHFKRKMACSEFKKSKE